MELLPDNALENSPIVANCCMNRERNLVGSNGYDKELGFNPLEYLKTAIQQRGNARWLDLCCGTGKALIEADKVVETENLSLEIVGVDLAGLFLPFDSSRLRLLQASLSDWQPETTFDLITCVHGLHYIGDKLRLLSSVRSWLTNDGRFVANLDVANIKLSVGQSSSRIIASELRKTGFNYSFRKKLVQCEGGKKCELRFRYLGADDQAGPNYTRQPGVDSHYETPDNRIRFNEKLNKETK